MSERFISLPPGIPEPERPPPRGRAREHPALLTPHFARVLACQAGFGFAFSAFFLLPTFLATELAASPAEIGMLATATSGVTVLLMVGMGAAVDRFGNKRLLVGGGLLMTVGSLAFASVEAMGPSVYGLRAAQAIAFAMVFVAGSAMTAEHAPDERLAEALGYFGLTGLAMNAVAPAVVEELASGPGWPAAFAAAAAGALVCALLALGFRDERGERERRPSVPVRTLALRGDQRRGGFVMACIGATFAALFVFHQLYALELGIERVRVFFISYAAAAVVARLGFGSIGDRWGRRRAATLSLVLYTLAAAAMMELASFGLGPIGAAFGFAHGIFYPTFSAMVVEPVAAHARGKALALLQAWFNVGIALAASTLGVIAETAGYREVFAIAGLCCAAALLTLALPRRRGARSLSAACET